MRLKSYILTFISVISFLYTYAQDPTRKHSIGLYQSLTDYNVVLLDNQVFSFDSSLSQSTRIAYQRRLSRTWMINAGISNGIVQNQNLRESFLTRAYVMGMDAALFFKINNGRILKENPRIAPYLTFGYRMDYVLQLAKFNENPILFLNQYGVGFNVKLSERTHIQLQSVLDQKLTSDFNTHMQYRLGITQSLGRLEDKLPKKQNVEDSDNDGIVNALDKCPNVFGSEAFGGCPPDSNLAFLVNADSLEQVVIDQRAELEKLQLELEELRNAGENTNLAKSREQELLLRIYRLQKSKDDEILALKKQLMAGGGAKTPNEPEPEKKVEEPKKEEPKPKAEVPAKKEEKPKEATEIPADKNYYVITMSSPNIATSKNWLINMKKKYPDAIILPQPNGYFRVGVYVGKDKEKGLQLMEQVRKDGYEQVWLSVE